MDDKHHEVQSTDQYSKMLSEVHIPVGDRRPSLQSLLGFPQDHKARPKEGQAVLEDFFVPEVKWRSRYS